MTNTEGDSSAIKNSLTKPSRAVTGLYAVMVMLALSIAALALIVDYRRTKEDLEDRAEAYAVSMATDVRWYVEVARQTLRRASERILRENSSNLSDVVSDAISDLPDGVVVAIYDSHGQSQGVVGLVTQPINISDRTYFKELQGGKDWVISNIIADRLTKTMTFAIGLSIRKDGEFKGAAVAYAPMNVFQDAWLNIGGRDSNAFIVHKDGWLTARLPIKDSEVYDKKLPQQFIDTFLVAPRGAYWADPSPIDGIARVIGFAEVPFTPLIAVTGQSYKEQINALWRRVGVSLAILTPILILLGYASWRIRNLMIEREETELRLRKSLAINEGFLLEIHHRVKNNLQSALSLIRMYVKSPEVMSEIEPRIVAMAKVHEHIYQSDRLVSVSAASYLTDIAQQIIYSTTNKIELITDIASIDLPSDVAMPVGQLLNEAIINAVKYGFDNQGKGIISIRLIVLDDGRAHLTIHNNGAPMPASKRSGIGSRLMPAFAMQIHGEVETTSDENGVTVSLKFPLSTI